MKRLDYIDISKGICILLIMLGHCTAGTALRDNSLIIRWIYSYHVMSFFVISGFVIEHIHEDERPFRKIIISNFKGIMIPYYVFQLCYIILHAIKHNERVDWLHILHLLHSDYQYATWFLLTLFFAKITYITIKKVKFLPHFFIAMLFCIGMIMPSFGIDLPFPFGYVYKLFVRFAFAVGLMYLGSVLYRFKQHFQDYRIMVIALAASLAIGIFNGGTSAFEMIYGNPILYVFSIIAGTVFVLCLSSHIESKVLSFYGKNSLIPMGTHELILMFLKPNILNWFLVVPCVGVITYLYTLIRNRTSNSRKKHAQ